MKTFALALLTALTLIATPAFAQEGTYTVAGEALGDSYTGVAYISKHGDFFIVEWTLNDGSAQGGIGIRTRDVLSVIFQSAMTGAVGIASYRIRGNRLEGTWTMPGAPQTFPETLTKSKGPLPKPAPAPTSAPTGPRV